MGVVPKTKLLLFLLDVAPIFSGETFLVACLLAAFCFDGVYTDTSTCHTGLVVVTRPRTPWQTNSSTLLSGCVKSYCILNSQIMEFLAFSFILLSLWHQNVWQIDASN